MQSDHEIEMQWRPSQWSNTFYYIAGTAALLAGTAVVFNVPVQPWAEKMAHGVWAGGLILILWKYFEVRCTRYQLSAEQLKVTQGVLNRLTDHLELYRIKDIQVFEPLYLRFLGLGNVWIHSSDRTTPALMVRAIPQPTDVAGLVRRQVEAERVRKGVREFD